MEITLFKAHYKPLIRVYKNFLRQREKTKSLESKMKCYKLKSKDLR